MESPYDYNTKNLLTDLNPKAYFCNQIQNTLFLCFNNLKKTPNSYFYSYLDLIPNEHATLGSYPHPTRIPPNTWADLQALWTC